MDLAQRRDSKHDTGDWWNPVADSQELDELPSPQKGAAPTLTMLPVCECQRTSGLHWLGRPESPELGARWVRTRAT